MTDKKDETTSKPAAPVKSSAPAAKGGANGGQSETKSETANVPLDKPAGSTTPQPKPASAGPSMTGGGAAGPEPPRPQVPKPEAMSGAARPDPGAGGPPPKAEATRNAPPPRRGGRALAVLALLVALGAAGGSGYLWYLRDMERRAQSAATTEQAAELDARLQRALAKANEQNTSALKGLGTQVESQQSALEELKKDLDARIQAQQAQLESELQRQEQQLRAEFKEAQQKLQQQDQQFHGRLQEVQRAEEQAVANLNDRFETLQLAQRGVLGELEAAKTAAAKGDVNAVVLSETEYLLRLADYKLRFQRDVNSAIEALEVADKRLAQVNELPFASVERMIRENLATLRGVKLPDVSALSHRIVELEQGLDKLPLRVDVQMANLKGKVKPQASGEGRGEAGTEATAPWWERAADAAWSEFKDIVIIRNERSSGPPLIAVEEEYFLRQNLRLELEAMRLALLRGDAGSYQEANQIARNWTQTYFQTNDEQTVGFLKELQALQSVQLNPYIPDLSGTLQAFRDVMERRQPVRSMVSPSAAGNAAAQPAGGAQAPEGAAGSESAPEAKPGETQP